MVINGNAIKINKASAWAVYLFLYLPLCLLPVVKYSVSYEVAGIFTMLPLFVVALNNARYCTIMVGLVLLGVLQGALIVLLGDMPITEIVNEPIRSVRYFVPCVLLDKVFNFSKKSQKLIWFFATALMAFVVFQTLYALETDPMVSRILAQGTIEDETIMSYRYQNVGGFGNCYALCLTFAMWVYFIFHSQKFMKIISIVMAVFIFYFAIRVQYMTMLLLCILAFVVVVLFSPKKMYKKLLGIVIAVFFLLFLPYILRWIASLGVESTIHTKLIEFADTLDGVNTLSDTTSRTELYKEALLAFLSNPIFGIANDFNSHSTVLGYAAKSGIIGLFTYFYGVKQMYSVTKANLKKQDIHMIVFNITFVLFIALAVVNPIHYVYEISVVLLFYIPLTLNLFSIKKM